MAENETVIYHNPACGTSRNTLALIRAAGITPRVVEYLVTPPSRDELITLAARIGLPLHDLLREKGTPYRALGIDDPAVGDAAILEAIAAHPILLNRPIVATPQGVRLCRPSEIVLDLLPFIPTENVLKEEGAPFLKDTPIASEDAGLSVVLRHGGLPTEDLADGSGRFFAYRSLDSMLLGYGGYELHGSDALIRAVVGAGDERGKGIGRNIVPLLLYRAYQAGARRVWLLTNSAAAFFAKLGFAETPRGAAPDAILATRQAAALCPASATLMTRRIGF